jgi:hypothetical protein
MFTAGDPSIEQVYDLINVRTSKIKSSVISTNKHLYCPFNTKLTSFLQIVTGKLVSE